MMTLNIGLNNNPASLQLIREIFDLFHGGKTKYGEGEYNGNVEPTAVVLIEHNKPLGWVERLCQDFNQECIAVKIDGVGYLVYNPDYQGERYEFDEQYFIEWSEDLPDSN